MQETRLYDPERHETRSMRSKEDAQDYRYFPDPDLPPLVVGDEWIVKIREAMPELPEAMRERLITQHGISKYDAMQLTASRELVDFYGQTVKVLAIGDAATCKLVANWVLGAVSAALNRTDMAIEQSPVSPAALAGLLARVRDNTISGKIAKDVFETMWESGDAADSIIERQGLKQISDAGAIEEIVDAVIAENAAIVAEYRAGKEKAFNSLVGKAMAATKGKANPTQVNELLKKKLGS
jgi:aspartyl-tRNA(Asn)/glutamyl-tRNA(Gln) amidotransferase subunit B